MNAGRRAVKIPQQGMTILEVLIATMLLAVVAIVIFAAFGIGLRAAALAGGMHTATGLAEEALAQLTASSCGASFGVTPSRREGPDLARFSQDVAAHQRGDTALWELSTTVSWAQERQQRSVTLTTLRYVSAACAFVGR
jgi:type II secretory pathway pseudopilin PulG